jgi:hypothetical protein
MGQNSILSAFDIAQKVTGVTLGTLTTLDTAVSDPLLPGCLTDIMSSLQELTMAMWTLSVAGFASFLLSNSERIARTLAVHKLTKCTARQLATAFTSFPLDSLRKFQETTGLGLPFVRYLLLTRGTHVGFRHPESADVTVGRVLKGARERAGASAVPVPDPAETVLKIVLKTEGLLSTHALCISRAQKRLQVTRGKIAKGAVAMSFPGAHKYLEVVAEDEANVEVHKQDQLDRVVARRGINKGESLRAVRQYTIDHGAQGRTYTTTSSIASRRSLLRERAAICVRDVDGKGVGVFALIDLPASCIVTTYGGELVDVDTLNDDLHPKQWRIAVASQRAYIAGYNGAAGLSAAAQQPLSSLGSFINHATVANTTFATTGCGSAIYVITNCSIERGNELTWRYPELELHGLTQGVVYTGGRIAVDTVLAMRTRGSREA